jgi:hypothetical protein
LQVGEDDARFYALAFCTGRFDGTTSSSSEADFLTLYFCLAPEFTRFSHHIVNAAGECVMYLRGMDEFDNLEYALRRGQTEFLVPPALWSLFPRSAISENVWEGRDEHRAAYFAARSYFCRLLWQFRIHAHFSPGCFFFVDPNHVPPSVLGDSAEAREIRQELTNADEKREKPRAG